MKKFVLVSLIFAALIACNSNENKEAKNGENADITKNPDYQKGMTLIADNGCKQCHNIDEAVTGPPYREVANKYATSDRDSVIGYLSNKIIVGGSGVWGQIPMIPHPGISPDDAKTIVRYILLLKK